MKKTIFAGALAAVMLLSACTKAPEKNNDEAVDLGSGIVLQVGGSELTTGEFQFFLDNIKSQMEGTELSQEDGWESEIEGKKAIDIAKERAYESAVQYLENIEIAKKLGISYTEKEMEDKKSQINESYFEKYDNKDELINLVCESDLYLSALQKKFVEENPVKDEDLEKYFNENKESLESKYMRAKHVLFLTQDEKTKEALPDDKIAEQKKKAEDVLARAKAGEDFDSLVSKYSEDPGSKSNPEGYVFTSGEMVQEFEDCTASLKPGEIGFCQTSYGFHIIKRLDLDVSSCKSVLTNAVYAQNFTKYMEEKVAEYKLEAVKNDEEYNKIK